MIEHILERIFVAWEVDPWLPKYPTLFSHLPHIAGGEAVASFFFVIGFLFGMPIEIARLIGSGLCTALFAYVEFSTAAKKKNWYDSMFDLAQYQSHWGLTLMIAQAPWAALYYVAYAVAYFIILINKPKPKSVQ